MTGPSASKVPVLRRNKATNFSTSTDPFSAATKTLASHAGVFRGARFSSLPTNTVCSSLLDHTGSLQLGIITRIKRLSFFSSFLPPSGKLPQSKMLNKLPSTRAFIAAEKWMFRSTGVGGFISPQNGNLPTLKTVESFIVDAIFCFVKISLIN